MWLLQDLAPHRKQGPGFLSRVGETVRAVANSVRGLKSRPEEFAVMQEYVDDFSNKMCCMDKVTQRIVKEQRGIRLSVQRYSQSSRKQSSVHLSELQALLPEGRSCYFSVSEESDSDACWHPLYISYDVHSLSRFSLHTAASCFTTQHSSSPHVDPMSDVSVVTDGEMAEP